MTLGAQGLVRLYPRLPLWAALLAVRTAYGFGPAEGIEHLALLNTPLGEAANKRDFIVLNPIDPMITTAFGLMMREVRGMVRPRSLRALAPGLHGASLIRVEENAFRLRPQKGFYAGPLSSMLPHRDRRMQVGDRILLKGMRVEVTEVDAKGQPMEARFTFDIPLNNPQWVFLHWTGNDYDKFKMPSVGTTIEL